MDKEEIDWLLPEFHGLVIGKQGATIKEITAISGARIKIEKDGPCYIYGNIEQRDTAKALILEKISNNTPKKRTSRGRVSSLSASAEWKEIAFISSEMIGFVIGKGGETIKGFEETYQVKFKSEEGKMYIYGDLESENNKMAIEGLHELLKSKGDQQKSKASKRQSVNKDGWLIVRHFPSKLIGMVIGKKGREVERLRQFYKLDITTIEEGRATFLAIKGGDEASRACFDCYLRSIAGKVLTLRKQFFLGSPTEIVVTDTHHQNSKLRSISLGDNNVYDTIDRLYKNIPGLRKTMIKALEKMKLELSKNIDGICNYYVHAGKFLSPRDPGIYPLNGFNHKDLLVYQRLVKGDLNLDKIQKLPMISQFIRYDMSIFTPDPQIRIRYRLFLAKENGILKFITYRQAGLREIDILPIKQEYQRGYFGLMEQKISALDIIDPETG